MKMTSANVGNHVGIQSRCRMARAAISFFLMAFVLSDSSQAATNVVLTTASKILSLNSAQASQKLPVLVTGVVTAAEPNWEGQYFVQDSTAGVFVINTNGPQPAVGDVVQVTGVSSRGGFAPCIDHPHWKKLGSAPLPEAMPVSMEQFMAGAEDGRRIELSGVVISAERSKTVESRVRLDLKSGSSRFRAFLPYSTNIPPASLVGATVRIRGTAATSFSRSLRYLLSVFVFMPQMADLIVDQSPNPTIWQEPFTPLNAIARYRGNQFADPRIRVRGIVTYQKPGENVFLHDPTGGLRMECYETNFFAPGETVEAVGFPAVVGFLPVLENAKVIKTSAVEKPVVPQKASIEDLFKVRYHADLVSLQGKLLDRFLRPLSTADPLTKVGEEIILTLESDRYFFSVETPAAGQFAELASIPVGSTLQVSGVCLLQADEKGHIRSIQILPPDASNIHILQRPSWWTPRRLLIALVVLLAVLLAGSVWGSTILHKNALLRISIAEKVKAQNELQEANDLLETRVEERTGIGKSS